MAKKKIRVGILGSTGLVGEYLIKILITHPNAQITFLGSKHSAGKSIQDVLPAFRHSSLPILRQTSVPAISEECDVCFFAGKTAESLDLAPQLLERSVRIIDCGAEFRFRSSSTYEKWYSNEHTCPHLLEEAVYGLPELYRQEIGQARLVANPGCYPTSALLPLVPFVRENLIDLDTIFIDSYSGISGAGRTYSEKSRNLFVDTNENIRAYAVSGHRHRPEIEEHLSSFAGREVKVNFYPHLVSLTRGIYTTIFVRVPRPIDPQAVLKRAYMNEPFVRVFDNPEEVSLLNVAGTNFCDLGYRLDNDRRTLILFSALDNLIKGASGQAIQSMNLMFGFPEITSLLWRSI